MKTNTKAEGKRNNAKKHLTFLGYLLNILKIHLFHLYFRKNTRTRRHHARTNLGLIIYIHMNLFILLVMFTFFLIQRRFFDVHNERLVTNIKNYHRRREKHEEILWVTFVVCECRNLPIFSEIRYGWHFLC